MSDVRVVVLGAGGRMGQEIIGIARRTEGVVIHGVVERRGHGAVGQPALPELPHLLVSDDLEQTLIGADVVIDFTRPEATVHLAQTAARLGVPAVIGTTGLDAAQRLEIAAAAEHVPIVFSPNTSVGVNVMLWLLRIAVDALGDEFDLELLEAHHRHKVDAPSGTALRMLEVLAEAREQNLKDVLRSERRGHTGARPRDEIGVQVIRGGDVAGEHTVFFLGEGERLEITHRASSRQVFARGALRAARWIKGRPPGLYGMNEVLGL